MFQSLIHRIYQHSTICMTLSTSLLQSIHRFSGNRVLWNPKNCTKFHKIKSSPTEQSNQLEGSESQHTHKDQHPLQQCKLQWCKLACFHIRYQQKIMFQCLIDKLCQHSTKCMTLSTNLRHSIHHLLGNKLLWNPKNCTMIHKIKNSPTAQNSQLEGSKCLHTCKGQIILQLYWWQISLLLQKVL